MATIGTVLSLMARKAVAFDFIIEKELTVCHLRRGRGYWVDNDEDNNHQRGLYPTAVDAVEAFMKDGEGK